MSQALQQSTYVNVVPRVRALEGAKRAGRPSPAVIDAELGRDLCIRDGYRALLTGQVSQRGSAYFVALQVVNPRDQMVMVTEFDKTIEAGEVTVNGRTSTYACHERQQ